VYGWLSFVGHSTPSVLDIGRWLDIGYFDDVIGYEDGIDDSENGASDGYIVRLRKGYYHCKASWPVLATH
jgi:hypothetical protein